MYITEDGFLAVTNDSDVDDAIVMLANGFSMTEITEEFWFQTEQETKDWIDQNIIRVGSLLPHEVNIIMSEDWTITIPVVGLAKCAPKFTAHGKLGPMPCDRSCFSKVLGLPDVKPGYCYIVSREVFEAAKNSPRGAADLYMVGEETRNNSAVGYKRLVFE